MRARAAATDSRHLDAPVEGNTSRNSTTSSSGVCSKEQSTGTWKRRRRGMLSATRHVRRCRLVDASAVGRGDASAELDVPGC